MAFSLLRKKFLPEVFLAERLLLDLLLVAVHPVRVLNKQNVIWGGYRGGCLDPPAASPLAENSNMNDLITIYFV